MTKATLPKPVTMTAATAPQAEPQQAKDSPGPVWKTQSNRVQGAIWRHSQTGKARYTVAISRSYKDQKGDWQNVHYFDRNDLADVRKVCDEAAAYLKEVVDAVESV